jgi:hypothetical protein
MPPAAVVVVIVVVVVIKPARCADGTDPSIRSGLRLWGVGGGGCSLQNTLF